MIKNQIRYVKYDKKSDQICKIYDQNQIRYVKYDKKSDLVLCKI